MPPRLRNWKPRSSPPTSARGHAANCGCRQEGLRIPRHNGTMSSPLRNARLKKICLSRRSLRRKTGLSNKPDLLKAPIGPTVVSIVGVNGTRQDYNRSKVGAPDSSAEEDSVACCMRHFPRRRHRATQTLGRAPQSRSHRRRLWRRCRVRGA